MFSRITGILFYLLLFPVTGYSQSTSSDRIFLAWGITPKENKGVICLRKCVVNGRYYYFSVSPGDLKTYLIPSDSVFVLPESWDLLRFIYHDTPYIRALSKAAKMGYEIQDAGFTRLKSTGGGIDLTIDLCPSRLPLDRIIFTDLIKEAGSVRRPVPVAICLTGRWMENHLPDLKWLDSLVASGDLRITWINHSYNHFTDKDLPLIDNFMLAAGTDINMEVTENERAMFERNITPSVFFRFPGLVSDYQVYEQIVDMGLIPIGSDAWLAKGEKPVNGSIVLIHGNGNEPVGVKDFILLLRKKEPEIFSGRWEMFDLRESIVEASSSFR